MAQKKPKEPQFEENQQTCSKCGAVLPENAKFCGHCGKKVIEEPLHCTNCGTEAKVGEKFCTTCGEPLHKEELEEGEEQTQQVHKKTKIDLAKLGIFLFILLLIAGLVIAGVYYGPKLFKKQQTSEASADTNQSEEEPEASEENISEGPCQDECNYEGKAKCEQDTFYYCEDKNSDGCLEKTPIDKCATGFSCANDFTCESTTNKLKLYQIGLIEELEEQADQRLKVGDSFETSGKLGGKIQDLTCDITKIYKEYARYVCEKSVPKQAALSIARTESTGSVIKITIKNSGSAEFTEDKEDIRINILLGGNTVCGLSIKHLNPNIDDALKISPNSDFELRLNLGISCTLEEDQTYNYRLEIGTSKTLTGSFKT